MISFAPCNFPFLHLQTVSSYLEFAHTQLCLKRDIIRHWSSHADNEGERCENENDDYPVYSSQI